MHQHRFYIHEGKRKLELLIASANLVLFVLLMSTSFCLQSGSFREGRVTVNTFNSERYRFYIQFAFSSESHVSTVKEGYPCEKKKLAFLQLLHSSEAAEKLRKSRRYWHLRKSQLLCRAAEKPAFMKLRSNYAGANTAGFCKAFACSFYADLRKSCVSTAFTQTCVKAAFLQLLCRPA